MKTFLGLSCVVLLSVFALPLNVEAAPTASGNVKVTAVKGTVTDGAGKALAVGDFVKQGQTVRTGPKSNASLLFSNGTKIDVQPDTEFSIDKFLQDPFDAAGKDLAALSAEPTTSISKMSLNKGRILGDVAKLNSGSSMNIETPLGTAGIRGTTFNLVVESLPGGKYRVTLVVTEGTVGFVKVPGQPPVLVGEGQEYNAITLEGTDLEDIEERLLNIAEDDNDFNSGDQGAGDVGTLNNMGGGGGSGGGGAQNPPSSPTPTPTPTPTPAPPVS